MNEPLEENEQTEKVKLSNEPIESVEVVYDGKNEVQIVEERLSEGAAMIAVIEKAALNPEVDIAKMEALLNMQERILDRTAKQAFDAAYAEMKPHLPIVIKNKANTQTSSKYATLDTINKTLDPILAEYGFASSTPIQAQTEKDVTILAKITHRDGHTDSSPLTMPLDGAGIKGNVNKTGPHALASSIMYARRVALCALLNISTGDDVDGNNTTVKVVTSVQAEAITTALMTCNQKTKDWFAGYYAGAVNVPKVDFDKLIANLETAAEKAEQPQERKDDDPTSD